MRLSVSSLVPGQGGGSEEGLGWVRSSGVAENILPFPLTLMNLLLEDLIILQFPVPQQRPPAPRPHLLLPVP